MSVRRVQVALEAALGPDAHVEHRFNHTGTDKLSFAVHVGGRALWVKVAASEDADWPLTTWSRSWPSCWPARCPAPARHAGRRRADRVGVPVHRRTRRDQGALHERFDQARSVLTGLHGDATSADLLGPPTTTAECMREVWLERFVADLDIIEGYVAKDLHAYLADEVEALGILVDELDEPVHAAVHGDPWHENWLVAPDRLWLLDWEDLSVGDPVVDDAILRHDALGTDPQHWPHTRAHAVARRALLLDAAVDVAADWVENTDPVVRALKESAYLAGVEAYRAEFR